MSHREGNHLPRLLLQLRFLWALCWGAEDPCPSPVSLQDVDRATGNVMAEIAAVLSSSLPVWLRLCSSWRGEAPKNSLQAFLSHFLMVALEVLPATIPALACEERPAQASRHSSTFLLNSKLVQTTYLLRGVRQVSPNGKENLAVQQEIKHLC